MDAEADQMCEATGNSRNGYRPRTLKTCVDELSLRVPKLRSGSFSPEDIRAGEMILKKGKKIFHKVVTE